jgi:LAS superfamily LD-carboxypeptidase LdcB
MNPLPRVAVLIRLATLAAGLTLLMGLAFRTAVDPAAARAMGPLPACRYDDILTSPRQYTDWSTTLVDTILRVPKTYVPPDLVPVSQAGIAGKGQIRALVIDDLRSMTAGAKAAGAGIGVQSAYRSYDSQKAVFDSWVAQFGRAQALTFSARPGHSEHQLGLAIDFRSDPAESSTLRGSWATTAAGIWMKAHAWEYGFVMSYPKGKTGVTCYSFEPWHFRYFGRELAGQIHASGRTIREYLWANFTTTVVPPQTAKPAATARPSHLPTLALAATPAAPSLPSSSPTAALSSPSPQPTGAPVPTATPTPVASPAVGDEQATGRTEPTVVAGAGLAIGTMVLGGAWLALRRRRYDRRGPG